MFEFLNKEDAITLLKGDHDKVKNLFDRFERAEDRREKKRIAAETIKELKIHAAIEEEIFYPAARREVESKLMNEADEEHHVAKLLIAELEMMSGREEHYDAKFKVLAESVRHHIREEEGRMFPEARSMELDMEALGRQLLARKQALMRTGVPECEEEKMIASFGAQENDSPARAAKTAGRGRKMTRKPAELRAKGSGVVRLSRRAKPASAGETRGNPSKPAASRRMAKKR